MVKRMIHIYAQDRGGTWAHDYINALMAGFSELGVRYSAGRTIPESLDEYDKVIVVHPLEMLDGPLYKTKAKVLTHVHGTVATTPYYGDIDETMHEVVPYNDTIDYILTAFHSTANFVENHFRDRVPGIINKLRVVGFPFDDSLNSMYYKDEKEKNIVIGGRLTPGKQWMLASYLLQDWVDEYNVIFACPEQHKDDLMLDLRPFENRGFQFAFLNHEQFVELIGRSEIYFTASMEDVSSVGLVEAIRAGCYPLVPHYENDFCGFNNCVKTGYKPFYKDNVDWMIENQPEIKTDTSMFDYKKCCEKILRI